MQNEQVPTSETGNTLFPGDKYARLTSLPKEKYEQVREMLGRGMSTYQVAKQIQEWGYSKDVTYQALAHMVARFRKDKVSDLEIVEHVSPKTATDAIKRLQRHANVLDEFSELIEIMKERLKLSLAREKQLKFPLQITNDMIAVAGKNLKEYGDLAVKVGIISRMLGEDVGKIRFEPKNVEQALQNPYVKKELISVVDDMLEEIDQAAQAVETPPDEPR